MNNNVRFTFLVVVFSFCCACSPATLQQEIKEKHEYNSGTLHYTPAYAAGKSRVRNSLMLYLTFPKNIGHLSKVNNPYDEKWNGSETALMLAATLGDIETMKKLIELGADINITSDKALISTMTYPYRETALHYAARTRQMGAYDFLIKQGANRQLKNTDGKTAEQLLEPVL